MNSGNKENSMTEFSIYSDSSFTGDLGDEKTYSFLNMLPMHETGVNPTIMVQAKSALDTSKIIYIDENPNIDDYHGGWINDEIAALISLKLGVRAHAGSNLREYNGHSHPYGSPRAEHNPPPPLLLKRGYVVPSAKKEVSINDLKTINDIYKLSESDFNSLIKAARNFQDSLWICESSPNLAWLLMISAIEVAANCWNSKSGDPIQRLKVAKPQLFNKLNDLNIQGLTEEIANEFSDSMGAAKKFRDFCLCFLPDEPAKRPEYGRIKWNRNTLRDIFNTIYRLRSNALHAGKPFPQPMCSPPDNFFGISEQAVSSPKAKGSFAPKKSTLGATWSYKEAPINLNLFVHMTHSILNKWWDSLYTQNQAGA